MENSIKGKISFFASQEGTKILVRDDAASRTFLEVSLTNDQLASMLSRMANTECEIRVSDLDKVGKKMECDSFEFECDERINAPWLSSIALANAGMGDWIADDYYNSKDSFFLKNGKQFARTTIRRWI